MAPDFLSAFPDKKSRAEVSSILVIEDNPTDVFLIKEALRVIGIHAELRIIQDGEEAMNLLERLASTGGIRCPDLILLDINLPRTDGFKVLERLRGSPKCGSTPVVVMSSSEASGDRLRAKNLRACEYFQKPPGYEAFLKIGLVVKRILEA